MMKILQNFFHEHFDTHLIDYLPITQTDDDVERKRYDRQVKIDAQKKEMGNHYLLAESISRIA